jgi:hypothetical protein
VVNGTHPIACVPLVDPVYVIEPDDVVPTWPKVNGPVIVTPAIEDRVEIVLPKPSIIDNDKPLGTPLNPMLAELELTNIVSPGLSLTIMEFGPVNVNVVALVGANVVAFAIVTVDAVLFAVIVPVPVIPNDAPVPTNMAAVVLVPFDNEVKDGVRAATAVST